MKTLAPAAVNLAIALPVESETTDYVLATCEHVAAVEVASAGHLRRVSALCAGSATLRNSTERDDRVDMLKRRFGYRRSTRFSCDTVEQVPSLGTRTDETSLACASDYVL